MQTIIDEQTKRTTMNTVNVLCEWIKTKCEKGASGEELKVLPEVIAATAQLLTAAK